MIAAGEHHDMANVGDDGYARNVDFLQVITRRLRLTRFLQAFSRVSSMRLSLRFFIEKV